MVSNNVTVGPSNFTSLRAQQDTVRANLSGGGGGVSSRTASLGTEFGATVSNPDAQEASGMLAELRAQRNTAAPNPSGTDNS